MPILRMSFDRDKVNSFINCGKAGRHAGSRRFSLCAESAVWDRLRSWAERDATDPLNCHFHFGLYIGGKIKFSGRRKYTLIYLLLLTLSC